jgi:1-acyl-sn-glycerol-3-phosphate acyltransferase
MQVSDFEEIRPYNNEEIPEKLRLVLQDPVFDKVLTYLFRKPEIKAKMRRQLENISTVEELQSTFVRHLVEIIVHTTTKGLTCSGLEHLDKSKAYLFISNHRDIILDAAFLNYLILSNGMNTTQIAIGDNLLIYDWIIHAVKLNRAFIVKRNIASRELLEASRKLSQYIRGSIAENNNSVWIAQREGRTKDGDDQTQLALLKMLNMSNEKSLAEGFGDLTIVPLSISYEIEPCGICKVEELIMREAGGYEKTKAHDLHNMEEGIFKPKGRVHFSFGKPILSSFLQQNNSLTANEFVQELAIRIDHRIHQYYKLWPYNYVAYELMYGAGEFIDHYSSQDMVEFRKMIEEAQMKIPQNKEEAARKFIKMYARPVENALIAAEVFRS